MDVDMLDWKPEKVKLESEISLDNCSEMDADFTASDPEASCVIPSMMYVESNDCKMIVFDHNLSSVTEPASSIGQDDIYVPANIKEEIVEDETFSTASYPDPSQHLSSTASVDLRIVSPELVVCNSGLDLPSKTEPGSSIDQEVMNVAAKIKEEIIEDETNSTDPLMLDDIAEDLPKTVPMNHGVGFVIQESMNIKFEGNCFEENVTNTDRPKVDSTEPEEEMRVEDPSPSFKSTARRYQDKTGSSTSIEQCSSLSELSSNSKIGQVVEHERASVASVHSNSRLTCSSQDNTEAASQISIMLCIVQLSSNTVQKEVVMGSTNRADKNLPSTFLSNECPTEQGKKNFSCLQCTAEFDTKLKLETHLRTHSDTRLFACNICAAQFTLQSNLKRHLKIHSNVRGVSCTQSSAQFKQKDYLQDHMLNHGNERTFACDQCSATFKRNQHLKRHLLTHCNEKAFACEQCPATFTTKSYLVQHLVVHSKEKVFSCELCSARFSRKDSLKQHRFTHSNERKFACELCFATFKRKIGLKQHLAIHSNEKVFACDLCSARYYTKRSLAHHIVIHSYEKAFSCEHCGAQFRRKDCLKQHLLVHTNKRMFVCDLCSATFKRKFNLKQHLLLHSNDRAFTCKQCSAQYIQKSNFKRHLLSHSSSKTLT